ncbi:hypothetical protein BDB01DRAFT_778635 [Pilobolus umbonatus]|nr:hypothetical protein BDB01DRAFT_778635 [Pilobolus umbonatus]
MAAVTQEFTIEMTGLPRDQLKDVLRGILHSIFFHRLLITVMPRELRVLNTTVSITDSPDIENLIEDKIQTILHLIRSSSQLRQMKLAVLFYEKRLKKNWYQITKTEEFVCWEHWDIVLNMAPSSLTEKDKLKAIKTAENQLRQCLMNILRLVNEHKEHIPSITITEGNPFPYQIGIQTPTESWNAMMKRLLVTDAITIEKSAHISTSVDPKPSISSTSSHSNHSNHSREINTERKLI